VHCILPWTMQNNHLQPTMPLPLTPAPLLSTTPGPPPMLCPVSSTGQPGQRLPASSSAARVEQWTWVAADSRPSCTCRMGWEGAAVGAVREGEWGQIILKQHLDNTLSIPAAWTVPPPTSHPAQKTLHTHPAICTQQPRLHGMCTQI
jgi:hypothetical protein